MKRTIVVGILLVLSLLGGVQKPPATEAAPRKAFRAPTVIAVTESGALNVLHSDFRLGMKQRLVLPPGMPEPRWVHLPTSGTFEDRLRRVKEGVLGQMIEDTLYWIHGTRLGIYVPARSRDDDIYAGDASHATAAVSAAVGLQHGTNPTALAVYVTEPTKEGWDWLTRQRWIDIVSTSYINVADTRSGRCHERIAITKIVDQGRLVFSAAGNTEQVGMVFGPSGVPEAYQVGGVDKAGNTFVPRGDYPSTPTRPYETGDRFRFPSAAADSIRGSKSFGGTSGATPSTAGRAAGLLQYARRLLGSEWTGVRDGSLAAADGSGELPDQGPLNDGRFDHSEVVNLLHHTAIPAAKPFPLRYLFEGYGALNDDAIRLAQQVLAGHSAEPHRPEEDAAHEVVESFRGALFPEGRCGG